MEQANIFLRLAKVDPIQGIVTGVLTSSDVDADKERLDYFGSKPYIQAWSDTQLKNSGGKSFGNVRVQHDPKKIAGALTSIDFDDDNQLVRATAQIADPVTLNLLRIGALTGFSIGGSYVSRKPQLDGTVLYIANPCEVSIVDRPCNPDAVFQSVKSDGSVELRKFWNGRDGAGELIATVQTLLDSGVPLFQIQGAFNLPLSIRKQLRSRREVLTARRLSIRKSRGWSG